MNRVGGSNIHSSQPGLPDRPKSRTSKLLVRSAVAFGFYCTCAVAVAGQHLPSWTVATPIAGLNTSSGEGCPIESPDGLSIYIASNRPGTLGGNDIWAADRADTDSPWSEPQNLGAPVNGETNDFCPTPIHGRWLLFVSERVSAETCGTGTGSGDIYLIRQNAVYGWGEPQHLGCADTGDGPNTTGAEFSPSLVSTWTGTYLFFSSTVGGNMDLYVSRQRWDGTFAPGERIDELSTEFDDRMPNVSSDGLTMVFSSNRTATDAAGGQDVYMSTRRSPFHRWSRPVNLGPNVNTAGNETRSTLSHDGERLYFGRDGDVYVSERAQRPRKKK
jgi:hypothetical protein